MRLTSSLLVAATALVLAAGVAGEPKLPFEIRNYTDKTIRVADDATGLNARRVPADTLPLPAQAGPPSPNNYRRVVAANGAAAWVSSSSLVIVGAVATPPPINCSAGHNAIRGLDPCAH